MSQNSLSVWVVTGKMSDIFHDLAWKISNFFRNYKLQRPSARWHVVRDNVFRYSRSLAEPLDFRKWPQVAAGASDRKWPQRASGRKWPQVAAFGKWPRVAASGRFQQVAASGRLFQFQIPHLMQPLWNIYCIISTGAGCLPPTVSPTEEDGKGSFHVQQS